MRAIKRLAGFALCWVLAAIAGAAGLSLLGMDWTFDSFADKALGLVGAAGGIGLSTLAVMLFVVGIGALFDPAYPD